MKILYNRKERLDVFMKKVLLFAFLAFVLLLSSGCRQEAEPPTKETYAYTPSETDETVSSPEGATQEERYHVDLSWQNNFELTYRYFDKSQGNETVTIREKKGDSFFYAEYLESGDKLLYLQNGRDLDQYALTKDFTGAHAVMKNKQISGVSSTFMKLSEVSEDLPSLSNVMYIRDESVAGRTCKKYLQRAYQNGELQESVYVWVDAALGFAARCEGYDAEDQMTVSWDLVSFSAGTATTSESVVDLSLYDIEEAATE